MKTRTSFSACFVAFLLAVVLGACRPDNNATPRVTSAPDKTAVKSDLSELRKYITVPGTPSAVQWQIVRLGPQNNDSGVPGPSTYQLIAILSYPAAELAALKTQLAKAGGDVIVGADAVQGWFTASVQAAFIKQSDGSYKASGTPLAADAFYRSPYLQGSAMLLVSGDVLVILITD